MKAKHCQRQAKCLEMNNLQAHSFLQKTIRLFGLPRTAISIYLLRKFLMDF